MKIKLPLQRKMILYLIPASILVFGGAMGYMISKARNQAIDYTTKLADSNAQKFAKEIKSELNVDANISRGVAQTFNSFYKYKNEVRTPMYLQAMEDVIRANPQFLSFWMNFELRFIDSTYTKNHGRARYTFYRNEYGNIKYYTDTLDREDPNVNSLYYSMKQSKEETILEPYTFSYSGLAEDEILETSICVPILKKGEFAGLVGADLGLDRFEDMVKNIEVEGDGYAFLLSNKSAIIAHPDEEVIGKGFEEVFPKIDKRFAVTRNIEMGRVFSYKTNDENLGEEIYYTYVPLTIGKTTTPWSLAICVPFSTIKDKAKTVLIISFIIGLIGVIILSILIILIARNITSPLKKTTRVLHHLSKGEVKTNDKLHVNSGDEIEEMANSVNLVVEGLDRTAKFAREIGQGKLNAEYQTAGENDVLGNSLLEMRQSLIAAEEEEKKRKIEDEKLNWATQGLAKFGDILRNHGQDIEDLSFNIMSNLVDYVDSIQGALFVKNQEEDTDEINFELKGAIAYDRKKVIQKSFKLGESLVGRCAYEKLTIYLEEVPEDYVHVTSGLGEANPRSILLVPALLNDEVYAIIELVSFNKFEKYQIEFIEKIGETIASTIANAKVNQRTNLLLDQSKHQAEELAAQEEEMRQNLEELQATQEEVGRLREEEKAKNEKMLQEVEKHRTALLKLLDHIPVKIFLKDNEGKMLIVNKKVLDVHNTTEQELLGKSDFDFIDDYNVAKKLWDAEQKIIHDGEPYHEVHKETINESEIILDSTKYPFYIDYLDETGILGVQLDVTDKTRLEEEVEKLKGIIEKLKKQQ